jgi:hypothetical protein
MLRRFKFAIHLAILIEKKEFTGFLGVYLNSPVIIIVIIFM